MKQIISISIILLLSACATPYQQRTTTQGAVLGAAAGAVIGHQSGNAAEGAAIGGALGALAGAVLAEQREKGIRTSAPRYHRRACRKGEQYFDRAYRARNLDRKIHLLKKGLRYCPNNPAAHNDLGVALVLRGDDRVARGHFNHALRLDPDYYPARRNLDRLGRNYQRSYNRRDERYGNRYGGHGRYENDDD
jgi:Flp pilus assembly protein TadD